METYNKSNTFSEKFSGRFFGDFGGAFVPEMLVPALETLDEAFEIFKKSDAQKTIFNDLQSSYTGRPSRLYRADNLANTLQKSYGLSDNVRIYLKLESHNHTGAHKINNVMGQILLARAMGKTHIIAETGAGQHGLATAAVCARFNMQCTIFMGQVDMRRQYPNVFSMRQMGAEVVPVEEGTQTLKDAVNVALKYWVEHIDAVHYVLGSALGPYPYPKIVQYFQSIIGEEVKTQIWEKEKSLPHYILACVGGGSNALGIFTPFLDDKAVRLIGVEAGGKGIATGEHASRFEGNARKGIAHGYKSYFLQNEEGQLKDTYSISAGLDYAGISPQLAFLKEKGRIDFYSATDEIALQGYSLLARTEGIIPALESAHAVGKLIDMAPQLVLPSEQSSQKKCIIVLNLSGRGDKDLFIVAPALQHDAWIDFLRSELQKYEDS